MQLKVPRAKVTETCRQLLETCNVTDINVQELPVEEVIRQLFGEQRPRESSGEPMRELGQTRPSAGKRLLSTPAT